MKAAVIGSTTWGTTLAIVLARKGFPVALWTRTAAEATTLEQYRESPSLPGTPFPSTLSVTDSLPDAVSRADLVVLAIPSQRMRQNISLVALHMKGAPILLSLAKGLETGTGLRMSQVMASELPVRLHPHIAALSGPNLAREIVRALPAATVVASVKPETAERAREMLSTPQLYVYASADVAGVELGGALKNVIAIAAGMVEELGYGDNAKAALMTRGLAEMMALGAACGASQDTFLGLSGMGDLVVTCASPLSRNHRVGIELARGRS
ncbi:MAG: NAD(P)H-dependent glycerol-3-phosphate dehydrogenase, partial [Dehalococcoidia bacterium]|nr:NAD(P)H-dependent glycerol-3-phosphate dehydrogenase [Dehalococcoidia bacterium]